MKRVKLNKPIIMSQVETTFHAIMERTNDHYGLSAETILVKLFNMGFKDYDDRDVRMWIERWNSMKYINVVPTYRIYHVNKLYRRVNIDSAYVAKFNKKIADNLRCALVDFETHFAIYGEVNTTNQVNMARELLEGLE